MGLLDDRAMTAGRAEQTAGDALALGRPPGSRFRARVRRRNSAVIWKVRTRPRLTRAACGSSVTSSPSSRICPALGCKRAGHQIDEGGLAGAVRADQRVAGAALQAEIDVVGDGQRAEALAQAAGFERRRSWPLVAHRRSRSNRPSMPPRARRRRAPSAARSRNTSRPGRSRRSGSARSCRAARR